MPELGHDKPFWSCFMTQLSRKTKSARVPCGLTLLHDSQTIYMSLKGLY